MINEEKAQTAIEMLIVLAAVMALALAVWGWVFYSVSPDIGNAANIARNDTINALNNI